MLVLGQSLHVKLSQRVGIKLSTAWFLLSLCTAFICITIKSSTNFSTLVSEWGDDNDLSHIYLKLSWSSCDRFCTSKECKVCWLLFLVSSLNCFRMDGLYAHLFQSMEKERKQEMRLVILLVCPVVIPDLALSRYPREKLWLYYQTIAVIKGIQELWACSIYWLLKCHGNLALSCILKTT